MKIKKETALLIAFPLLLIIIAGAFLWIEYRKNKTTEDLLKWGVLPDGFISEETEEGIIIKNEEIGIIFKVPRDWTYDAYMSHSITFNSPNYVPMQRGRGKSMQYL